MRKTREKRLKNRILLAVLLMICLPVLYACGKKDPEPADIVKVTLSETPKDTVTAAETPTPVPTETAVSTAVPTETVTPTETATEAVTLTDTPTGSPVARPTNSPAPTQALRPTQSPAPTYAPTPTEVPEYDISDGVLYKYNGTAADVVIPDGVTAIGQNAFRDCSGIVSVIIPDSVATIGPGAFNGCTSLTSITIPDSVTAIYGFEGSSENGSSGAFEYCTALTEITLPDSIKYIESWSFFGCTALRRVSLPEGLKSIGSYAFADCSSLTEITLPGGVAEIWDYAFAGSGVENINIPDSVEFFGRGIFTETPFIESLKHENGLILLDDVILESYGIKGDYVIPDGIRVIASGAFHGCSELTSVVIPDSVESMCSTVDVYWAWGGGTGPFSECTSLSSVTLPVSLNGISDIAFQGCTALTSVNIPEGVTFIGDGAFADCTSLTSVTIPESVTGIGDGAFSECTSLTSITVPYDLLEKYYGAFRYTPWFSALKDENGLTIIGNTLVEADDHITTAVIPEGVTEIDWLAFSGCYDLTDLTIPESIRGFDYDCFRGCNNLQSVTIPDSLFREYFRQFDHTPWYDSLLDENGFLMFDTVLADAPHAYGNAVIPDGITEIGFGAFGDCASLRSVTIPDSVTSIGNWAFYGCSELDSVLMPDSVGTIGKDAFFCCRSLRSVKISNSVARICSGTFFGCDSLTSVIIPDSVEYIEAEAFGGIYCPVIKISVSKKTVIEPGAFPENAVIEYRDPEDMQEGDKICYSQDRTVWVKYSIDGTITLYYEDQVIDITDKFKYGICYLYTTGSDGNGVYLSIQYKGEVAIGSDEFKRGGFSWDGYTTDDLEYTSADQRDPFYKYSLQGTFRLDDNDRIRIWQGDLVLDPEADVFLLHYYEAEDEEAYELAEGIYIQLYYPLYPTMGAFATRDGFMHLLQETKVDCFYHLNEDGLIDDIRGIYYP